MCIDLRRAGRSATAAFSSVRRRVVHVSRAGSSQDVCRRLAEPTKTKNRMQNDQGQPVDLYIPRKCSWTNRLIGASDQASVQINVGTIDPNTGLHTGGSETYALSGYVRNKGESDMALTELVRKADETM